MTSKRGTVQIHPGKPLEFSQEEDVSPSEGQTQSSADLIGGALKAYRGAAEQLLKGKYSDLAAIAPTHLRNPGNIFAAVCQDGMFVRYDKRGEDVPRIRVGKIDAPVATIALQFSEQVLYLDVEPFHPEKAPKINLGVGRPGELTPVLSMDVAIFSSTKLPPSFEMPKPPARPTPIISIQSEVDMALVGTLAPVEGARGTSDDNFLAVSRIQLPVGWSSLEVYPLLSDDYWQAAAAPMWAELDILATAAQRNLQESRYSALDSRVERRARYSSLLEEFQGLLEGPEEPVHQFLKKHPELISPTAIAQWSKLKFGDRISDFVFREPYNDYELVELEAPIREIFRKDGQQREELTHAFNQISDWIAYIEDNRQKVETELGLAGISTNPRSLIVIGRSAALTDENRRKLITLQNLIPKLRIMTYDDLLESARATLTKILGPLGFDGPNSRVLFFKGQL
jgi:hypothetical protein